MFFLCEGSVCVGFVCMDFCLFFFLSLLQIPHSPTSFLSMTWNCSWIWICSYLVVILFCCLWPKLQDGFETNDLQQTYLENAKQRTKMQYHPSEDQIKTMYDFEQQTMEIIDDTGNKINIPQHATQNSPLYYQPGSRPMADYNLDYADAIQYARM